MSLSVFLKEGAEAVGVQLNDHQQNQLLNYLHLLSRWNRVYNLTAITDRQAMVTFHLLDSLSIAPYINSQSIIDVGTGAGLPGLILAIALPKTHWVLLDAAGKKIRFLKQAVYQLGITNADPVHSRVETYTPGRSLDAIVTRAVGAIQPIVHSTQHLSHPQTQWLFMKSALPADKTQSEGFFWHYRTLTIPGIIQPRYLIYNAV